MYREYLVYGEYLVYREYLVVVASHAQTTVNVQGVPCGSSISCSNYSTCIGSTLW